MWLDGFLTALNLNNLLWLALGTLWGLFIGVLPALGPNFAVAIMLPFTYGMDTASAMIFLCAAHASCNYGDSLASILINIPGGPGTVATCWDGYPMARQGKAVRALGIATFASFFGGGLTWLSLVLLAKPVGKMALSIGGPEYFALGVMALSLVAVAARGETVKGLIMVCLGLLLGSVGVDPVTGVTSRFSFGILWLEAGVPIVVSTLGIFAISQIISLLEEKSISKDAGVIGLKGSIFSGFMDVVRRPFTLLRAGFVGWFIGILPALGVSLAGISSYLVEKNYSKEKNEFGSGAPGGLVAAEVGKGACVVGDLIPTFTLGVPGSVTGAILMAALIIHGIEPGPRFLLSGPLPYVVFSGLFLGQLAYVVIGPTFCRLLARVIYLPNAILVPFITVLAFLGAFCERNYAFDLLLMTAFGAMAYALDKVGYSVICIVLGLILEDIVEANLNRSLQIGFGSPAVFLERPIALVMFAITFLFLVGPFLLSYFKFRGLSLGKGRAETQERKVHLSEVLSLLILAGVMVTFIVMGRAYIPKVRLFPESVAIAGLLFVFFRLSILAGTAFRSKGSSKTPPIESPAKERPVVSWPVSMAILVGYGALVNVFGFVVTTGLFVIAAPFVAGYRKPIGLMAMAVGAMGSTLLFAKLLKVLLPVGWIYSTLFY